MVSSALTDRRYRPSADGHSLAPALEQLAAAFADCPTPTTMEHCTHCVTDAEIASLLGGPIDELPADVVSRFVRKVGTTWGGADDLRRITPRVLALAADHRLTISRSLVWEKLRWADWTSWPTHQVDAVGRFLLAEFGRLLRVDPRPAFVAHRWLAQVSTGIDELSGFLTVWNDCIGPLPDPSIQSTAVNHLVELLTSSPLRPDLPATMSDVFGGNQVAAAQVTAFLTGPGTYHDLRRVAADKANTPGARRVSVAVERLRRFRAAVERGTPAPGAPGPSGP